ncbi:tetratricopeptide repeat protein [Leptospira ognonensis]|uniref:Tetratricopeptide repeat protein n=2 Tax=Leptospira ognonensis TaxID=2484945 RepID=A0A4R9JX36_9LEPT|nr:tetratricopeptide repeat protein [Leptospira ognonensis]
MIPKISLSPWRYSSVKGIDLHNDTLSHLVSLEFQKMSSLVFLGFEIEKADFESTFADIALGGDFDVDRFGITFQAEIKFPKHFKSYSGQKLRVSWDEIGKAPIQITESYLSLIREKIRLNRYLLLNPKYESLPFDINPEILSSSEYLIYKSAFDKSVTELQQQALMNQLISAKPKSPFLRFESLLSSLKWKGSSVGKDVWKVWTENKFMSSDYTYLLSYEIAKGYYSEKQNDLAFEFFQLSRKERENQGKVFHEEYAETLSLIGRILISLGKSEEALFYFTSAKEMYETLAYERKSNYLVNQIHYSLLLAQLGQREIALNEFYKLEKSISQFHDFDQALFYYNFSRLQFSLSSFEASLHFANLSKKKLFQIGQTNHELSFHLILLSGAINFSMGNYNQAQFYFEEIINAKAFLPIEDNLYYRNALLNLAYIYQIKGSVDETESYYKQYTRLSPYSGILPLESKPNLQITNYIQFGTFEIPKNDAFTTYEESVIKSSTGRYIFNGQDEEIRARTYQDRLEDTNEFLRDLLHIDFFGTQALAYLKNSLFPPNKSYVKGENVVFIDIGPALNNVDAPGITSQSVAYHFPKMNVILWELPTEVELFLKKVPNDKKEQLYSFGNIRIISADGVGNFLESYEDTNRWLFRNRNIPKLKDKTIIIRAANSIDIYETFNKIQPHFKDIGATLMDNPVLYFFNRSILFKPIGSTKFTIIGYQSVRGFHHNFQSLDRNGEPPYTLAKYTLNEY